MEKIPSLQREEDLAAAAASADLTETEDNMEKVQSSQREEGFAVAVEDANLMEDDNKDSDDNENEKDDNNEENKEVEEDHKDNDDNEEEDDKGNNQGHDDDDNDFNDNCNICSIEKSLPGLTDLNIISMKAGSISCHQSGGNSKSYCPSAEVPSFESGKWNQLFTNATTRRQTVFQIPESFYSNQR